jgi:2-haloacid dehalogenase
MFHNVIMSAFILAFLASVASLPVQAETLAPRYKAVAFDYFVIFNPDSVVAEVEKAFPGKGRNVTMAWRAKQFGYGYLRSIVGEHKDFLQVTEDALAYTLERMKLDATEEQRRQILNAYFKMTPWPDAIEGLKELKTAGVRIITIANFSQRMLVTNANNAGIADLFEELLSTELNGTYKPDPKAYALGKERLGLQNEEIVYVAFAGGDVYGAKRFGFPTYWVNRFGLPSEKLGVVPDGTSSDFRGLLDFVLGVQ